MSMTDEDKRPPTSEPTVTKAALLEMLADFDDDEPIYVLVFGKDDQILAIVDHGHQAIQIGREPDGSDTIDAFAFITALVPVEE
jgi:hypothetical protein